MLFRPNAYLDNSATTPVHPRVRRTINHYLKHWYGNPSSIHKRGSLAKASLEMARERLAASLGCAAAELVFTGSGSEANNLAIKGVFGLGATGSHGISSRIEHSSIRAPYQQYEALGMPVSWIGVDAQGHYRLDELAAAIRPQTRLISLSLANNEIGTIQDLGPIAALAKSRGVLLHVDAVQALPHLDIDLSRLGADLVSFSGHKLGVPKGIGLLWIRAGTQLQALVAGGEQESGLRSGTENLAYVMGLDEGLRLNLKHKARERERVAALRERLVAGVLATIPDVVVTGDPSRRIAGHASFCFKGIRGREAVKLLSWHGFELSSGSACSSRKQEASAVLSALGITEDYIHGSLRVSLGRGNTRAQVDALLRVLPGVVAELRGRPPVDSRLSFVSQAEFRKRLRSEEPLQVLDARPVALPPLKLPGLLKFPLWRMEGLAKQLDPERETVVICYHGDGIAPEVQAFLHARGFRKVMVLQGGAAALAEAEALVVDAPARDA